jgi:hypothetical protein
MAMSISQLCCCHDSAAHKDQLLCAAAAAAATTAPDHGGLEMHAIEGFYRLPMLYNVVEPKRCFENICATITSQPLVQDA